MPKICYKPARFHDKSLARIALADQICSSYAARGFSLTLRQIYYRFVAGGHIPNDQREYKNLGQLLNDARLAGLIDWDHMEDRTRNLKRLPSWESRASILRGVSEQFRYDLWKDQEYHVEVWIEKDALVGVVEGAASSRRVGFFSCRGYTSQSELWGAAMRLARKSNEGKQPVVIHLGDHDPSGIDMSRDIEERLRLFSVHHGVRTPEIIRIALNADQIEQYNPPPNPAKLTDSRAAGYIERFGDDSWELDALEPEVIDRLIRDQIEHYIDWDQWNIDLAREDDSRARLARIADREDRRMRAS